MDVNFDGYDFLVVGAGFYGAVMAERISSELGKRVLVIDRKSHLGGNSFSSPDAATGIEIHRYGSHIFHTFNQTVWEYINRFAVFNSYRHKVLIRSNGRVFFMPINLKTINDFYGLDLDAAGAVALVAAEVAKEPPHNSLEGKAIARIGRPLYEAMIYGYTRKQWDIDPARLPGSIIDRLPVRFNYNTDYFTDPWQGIPVDGYGVLFERLLDHQNITVRLETDFAEIRHKVPAGCRIIYSGPVDALFDYCYGSLAWRTLRFEFECLHQPDFQGTSVINYGDIDIPYTRIHEFKHYQVDRPHLQNHAHTVICREYPCSYSVGDDTFYPVNDDENNQRYRKYMMLLGQTPNLWAGGRNGSYQYLNMDQTIAAALDDFNRNFKHGI